MILLIPEVSMDKTLWYRGTPPQLDHIQIYTGFKLDSKASHYDIEHYKHFRLYWKVVLQMPAVIKHFFTNDRVDWNWTLPQTCPYIGLQKHIRKNMKEKERERVWKIFA